MAAPVQPTPLNGIAGYESATIVNNQTDTVVTLKKKERGKDYWVTLTFYRPIDEANIRSYLAAKEAKEKIEQMVKQYGVFESGYGSKKDFKLESTGIQLYINYIGKKGGLKRLNISESEFELTFFHKAEEYQKKIEDAVKAKKNDREKKFRDKKIALNAIKEKFRPLSKILATPAHPDPRPADPAIRVGAAPQQAAPGALALQQAPGEQAAANPNPAQQIPEQIAGGQPPAQQAGGGPAPAQQQVPAPPAGGQTAPVLKQQVPAATAAPANA